MSTRQNSNYFMSLYNALSGLGIAIYRERNLKIHLFVFSLVIIAGIFFKLSKYEWISVIMVSALVITAELFNTAIEITVDMYTKRYRVRAKIAKDVAAGAVLFSSLIAVVIGLLVFYNKLVDFF